MEALKIKWQKQAALRHSGIAAWYEAQMGMKAALLYLDGMTDTINTLAHSPRIGMLDKEYSTVKTKYYSFLSHPKYRITYRFTKTTLYIVAIRATMMKHN